MDKQRQIRMPEDPARAGFVARARARAQDWARDHVSARLFSKKPTPDVQFDLSGVNPSASHDDAPSKPSGPRQLPDAHHLDERLENSVRNIIVRRSELEPIAAELNNLIESRRDGQMLMFMLYLSLAAAAGWMLIAFGLGQSIAAAAGAQSVSTMFGVLPVDHAATIQSMFRTVSFAGFGLGVLLFLMLGLSGGFDNEKLRGKASELGEAASAFAKRFDHTLDETRRKMDDLNRGSSPVTAVVELSDGHLTALEAAMFFDEIGLTDDRSAQGLSKLNDFLRYSSIGGYGGGVSASGPVGLVTGGLFGFIAGAIVYRPPSPPPVTSIETLLSAYPSVALWFVGPALALVGAGFFLAMARSALTIGLRRKALADALEAIRAPFAGNDAPRKTDIVQRIVDALAIYVAWVSRGGSGGTYRAPGGTATRDSAESNSEENDVPAWRKKPEGPRFVETGFQATPKSFRADPHIDPPQDFSEGFLDREPGSKRSLFGLKKQRGD